MTTNYDLRLYGGISFGCFVDTESLVSCRHAERRVIGDRDATSVVSSSNAEKPGEGRDACLLPFFRKGNLTVGFQKPDYLRDGERRRSRSFFARQIQGTSKWNPTNSRR